MGQPYQNKKNFEKLGKWFANCDPQIPLDLTSESDRALYVAFDDPSWTSESKIDASFPLRGHHVVKEMVKEIEFSKFLSHPKSAQLFAGFRGTGKSTELSRVAEELRDDYTVLWFKADDYHHMSDALSIEELVLVLAAGIGEQASKRLGIETFEEKNVWRRMADFLNQEVEVKKLKFSFSEVELKGRLRQGEKFKDDLQQLLRERPDALKRFFHELVDKVTSNISPRKLVILVDGLDKFFAPKERIGEVYRSMSDLFFHHAEVFALPSCHIIYTIPPYLAFINQGIAEKFGGKLHVLPSVKIHHRPPKSNDCFQPGVRAMEEALANRVELDELFGDGREACVAKLVSASGGQTRDLYNLIREVIRIASDKDLPVGLTEVERAVSALEQSRGTFFREVREILSLVHETGQLESLSETQLSALAGAMDQQLVLCYCNGEPWYDVHPLVLERLPRPQPPDGA